jgi:hypothetical protein
MVILCSDRNFQSPFIGKQVSDKILDAAREKGVYNEIAMWAAYTAPQICRGSAGLGYHR